MNDFYFSYITKIGKKTWSDRSKDREMAIVGMRVWHKVGAKQATQISRRALFQDITISPH
jgi:hypothetical protein